MAQWKVNVDQGTLLAGFSHSLNNSLTDWLTHPVPVDEDEDNDMYVPVMCRWIISEFNSSVRRSIDDGPKFNRAFNNNTHDRNVIMKYLIQ